MDVRGYPTLKEAKGEKRKGKGGNIMTIHNIFVVTGHKQMEEVIYGKFPTHCSFILVNLTGVDAILKDGDKIVVIPPVSGGAVLAEVQPRKTSRCSFAGSNIEVEAAETDHVDGLPEWRLNGVYYIVSKSVAEAAQLAGRDVGDLLIYDSQYRCLSSLASFESLAVDICHKPYITE